MASEKQTPQGEPAKKSEGRTAQGESQPPIYLGRLSDSTEWPEIRPGDRVTVRLVGKDE